MMRRFQSPRATIMLVILAGVLVGVTLAKHQWVAFAVSLVVMSQSVVIHLMAERRP